MDSIFAGESKAKFQGVLDLGAAEASPALLRGLGNRLASPWRAWKRQTPPRPARSWEMKTGLS